MLCRGKVQFKMHRRGAEKCPQELLDLFDRHVRGEINRRNCLGGAEKHAVGGDRGVGEPGFELRR